MSKSNKSRPAARSQRSPGSARSAGRNTGARKKTAPAHRRRSTAVWLAGVIVIALAGVAVGAWRVYHRPAPAGAVLDRPGAYSLGPANAPVTIVEFADFECPACRAEEPLVKQLLRDYPTQVRLVFREFPLPTHEYAELAAEAAEAAGAQGKFWEMHDILYENQQHLTMNDILGYATTIGLDVKAFQADLESHKYQAVVQKDVADGQALGVQGTPTFFINGTKYLGALPYDQLTAAVERALKAAGGK